MNHTPKQKAPLTAADLMHYARRLARIQAIDYFEPGYARIDEVRAWRADKAHRDRDRARILRDFPGRVHSSAPLIPGRYWGGRLEITASEIDYTAGQYAPREIYLAVYDYFRTTNTTP